MSEYQIGSEMYHKDKTWRIVRTIGRDSSLFEDEFGAYIIHETYVQIKSAAGELDHIVLETERIPYVGPDSLIKALNPLQWRKE